MVAVARWRRWRGDGSAPVNRGQPEPNHIRQEENRNGLRVNGIVRQFGSTCAVFGTHRGRGPKRRWKGVPARDTGSDGLARREGLPGPGRARRSVNRNGIRVKTVVDLNWFRFSVSQPEPDALSRPQQASHTCPRASATATSSLLASAAAPPLPSPAPATGPVRMPAPSPWRRFSLRLPCRQSRRGRRRTRAPGT
jgi:hypothetical protein